MPASRAGGCPCATGAAPPVSFKFQDKLHDLYRLHHVVLHYVIFCLISQLRTKNHVVTHHKLWLQCGHLSDAIKHHSNLRTFIFMTVSILE